MHYSPSIESRPTEQLIDLVANSKDWEPEAVEMAKNELNKREVSLDIVIKKKKNQLKYKRRIEQIRAKVELSAIDKCFMFFLGPLVFFILRDFSFVYVGNGYQKKNRQSLIYFIFGLVFWFGIIIGSVYWSIA